MCEKRLLGRVSFKGFVEQLGVCLHGNQGKTCLVSDPPVAGSKGIDRSLVGSFTLHYLVILYYWSVFTTILEPNISMH